MAWVPAGGGLRGLAVLLLLSLSVPAWEARADEPWPHEVRAFYKVHFNGFEVGSFSFNATADAHTYTLSGDARLSVLLGIVKWKGETHSVGMLTGDGPLPGGYTFDYNGIGKTGSVKMNFAGENVQSVAVNPPTELLPDTVPLRKEHLKGVLDPLSALMALSRGSSGNPCVRRVSIFDGRQRFDLILSFRRHEKVVEAQPSGQPSIAFVCGVRYVPVAGYRMTDETRRMAATADIELTLRPVPSAHLFVPYQITIPTVAGLATLTSNWVQITTQHEGQIALVY
jgi:uncharacterized protein DUF3108